MKKTITVLTILLAACTKKADYDTRPIRADDSQIQTAVQYDDTREDRSQQAREYPYPDSALSKRDIHSIYMISGIFPVISIFCIFYLRKRHIQYKAEKKEWEAKLQAEITQANLIKQELAEKKRENAILQEKVNRLTLKKRIYTEEEYKTSALYIKVSRITKTLATVDTQENLNEEEWSQFTALTNAGRYGIITYLNERYNLSSEEIQICCLYLAQVPVIYIGHFVKGQARSTIQLKSKNILQKMRENKDILLKNALFSLVDRLRKC